MENIQQIIALTLIENIGPINARKLISYCGGIEGVMSESKKNLSKIPGIGEFRAKGFNDKNVSEKLKIAEEEILLCEQKEISIISYTNSNYPPRLKNCDDAPLILYAKGNHFTNEQKSLAIVGTRNATEYGKEMTQKIVEKLKPYNITIVSGLAYGIDILAHRASIQNKIPTVGVLAHGLHTLYPASHKKYVEQMIENGGVITEFLYKSIADRENFPKRNRIVAGMCDATLVVESAKKGGALITADIANSYNRDVFAIPGKVDDKYSEGCNFLIKTNRAALVQNAEDITLEMGWTIEEKNKPNIQQQLFVDLQGDEKIVYDYLKNESKSIDNISYSLKISGGKLAGLLLSLELKGVIKSMPGKMYRAV